MPCRNLHNTESPVCQRYNRGRNSGIVDQFNIYSRHYNELVKTVGIGGSTAQWREACDANSEIYDLMSYTNEMRSRSSDLYGDQTKRFEISKRLYGWHIEKVSGLEWW